MINRSTIKSSLSRAAFALAVCAGLTLVVVYPAPARETNSTGKTFALPAGMQEEPHGLPPLEQRLIEEGLIDVSTLDPSIMVDLKYAKADNFMGTNVYGDFTRAYLRPEAAWKLVDASRILQERHPGLRILVGDAFRPRSIQHKMWKIVEGTPMQPYVANPYSGSMHNHGAAVDVTLYCVETQERLDMGTPFDFFGSLAQPRLESKFLRSGKLNEQQVANRLILRNAMCDAGWQVLPIEWWHFNAFPRDQVRRNYSIIE